MSFSTLMLRAWIRKMLVRPSRSGSENSTFLSSRPGRMSAGSRVSGRLVAISTLILPLGSKPSSWLISSSIVRCTSLSPPAPSSNLAPPTASISSKKIRQAFLVLAISKSALTHVLLHQLGPDHPDEAGVGPVGDGPGAQGLAGAGGAVEQHALGRLDSEVDEPLRVEEGGLHHLPELLYLLLAAADVTVRHVRLLLHLHHGDGGVDLRREGDVDLVLVPVHADPHTLLDIRGRHRVGEVHHELGELLHVDDVLGVVAVGVDDLGAASYLERLLGLEALLVGGEVPEGRRRQAGVRLLDPRQLVDPLGDLRDVGFHGLECFSVLALSVALEQRDVLLVQSLDLLLLLLALLGLHLPHVVAQVILPHPRAWQ